MKQSKFLEITVPVPHWTSRRKAGTTNILLRHGQKVYIVSNLWAPDHDRQIFEEIVADLQRVKPDVLILLGRIIHDHAFELMGPRAIKEASEDEPPLAPEVSEAYESSEHWEDRVINLGKLLGESILLRLVEAAGPQCQMFYVPALEGSRVTLPPESNIKDIIQRIQGRVDGHRRMTLGKEYKPEKYPKIPLERRQFAQLLGVEGHRQIKVLRFGSTIMLHCMVGNPDGRDAAVDERRRKVLNRVRVEVGRRKVMHPITEAYNATMLNSESFITSFPPQLSNGWFTKCVSADVPDRKHLFFSQIGMMFARERHDFGDGQLERYATGVWSGHCWRGALHGKAFPFLRGTDGRRVICFWSNVLVEKEPGNMGRQDWIEIP